MFLKIFFIVCLAAEIYSDHIDKKPQVLDNKPLIRIVGGKNAHPGESPYVVSIQLRTFHGSTHTDTHVCGGAIIHEHWILTAAHCHNKGEALLIKAGKHDLSKKEDHEQVIEVTKVIKPTTFNRGAWVNDIALAKLRSPLQLNQHVAKIALPAKSSIPKGWATLSGWGSTSPNSEYATTILQNLMTSIINLRSCKNLIGKLNFAPKLIKSHMCTLGSLRGGLGGCAGDSGSPLVVTQNGHQEVVGIFSWSYDPCGSKGSPDVYTRVSAYIKWIEKVMHKHKI